MTREQLVAGLRNAADFFEANPDLPVPYCAPVLDVWVNTKEELQDLVRGHGKWEKKIETNYIVLRKSFGGLHYDVNCAREKVCERIVVGKRVVPAREAFEVDEVEWKCSPVLDIDTE